MLKKFIQVGENIGGMIKSRYVAMEANKKMASSMAEGRKDLMRDDRIDLQNRIYKELKKGKSENAIKLYKEFGRGKKIKDILK